MVVSVFPIDLMWPLPECISQLFAVDDCEDGMSEWQGVLMSAINHCGSSVCLFVVHGQWSRDQWTVVWTLRRDCDCMGVTDVATWETETYLQPTTVYLSPAVCLSSKLCSAFINVSFQCCLDIVSWWLSVYVALKNCHILAHVPSWQSGVEALMRCRPVLALLMSTAMQYL